MSGGGALRTETVEEPSAGRHELLAARLLAAVNGALAALAALAVATVVVQDDPAEHPPAFRAATLAAVGILIAVGMIAQWSGRRLLTVMNGVAATVYLALVLLTWPVLALSGGSPSGQLSWLLTVTSLPVLAAVIAWGPAGGWIVLGALGVFMPLLRIAMDDRSANAITNNVQSFATAVLLCALASTTLARAQQADAAAAVARDAAAREAESAARRAVDARAQALVHDEVLATLAFAARATAEMRPALAAQARRAREALNALTAPSTEAVAVAAFRAGLRELARDHDAQFSETLDPERSARSAEVPGDVAEAMTGAVQQALVNVRAHAAETRATVTLTRIGEGIRIEVRDDGPGFDPDAVVPGRLGIAVSIVARMRAVGGRAEVRTTPGEGVVVVASWSPSMPWHPFTAPAIGLLRDRDMRLTGALLAAGPLVLALYSLFWLRQPLPAVSAGVALAAAFVVVSWRADRAGTATVAVAGVLALAAVGTMLGGVIVPDTAETPTYAGMWPYVTASVVLGMLCLRARPAAALILMIPATALLALAVVPGPFDEVRAAVMRAVVVVAASAGLAISLRLLDRHAERNRAAALQASSERAWLSEIATRAEEKIARWDETFGALLTRIAEGTALTDDEIGRCLVHEGELRDGYRAGRLGAPDVSAAAARARARGVDVVLIDDVADREIDDEQLERLRMWLVEQLDGAAGSFIARILPAGRDALATASSGAASTRFGG